MRNGFFVPAKQSGGRRCSASLTEARQRGGGKDARSCIWIRWNLVFPVTCSLHLRGPRQYLHTRGGDAAEGVGADVQQVVDPQAAELPVDRGDLLGADAGGGEELPKFKAMAKDLGIEKKCLLPGWRADSAEILAVSDIYAMTSLWEGLPRSLVEAFASGLPAVCYRADGVTDILKDGVNGYSMEKKDISSYIEKLGKLIDDVSLRKKLAEGAKDTELSEFDIDFMVLQQEKLYLGLKDGSKPCMIDLHKA